MSVPLLKAQSHFRGEYGGPRFVQKFKVDGVVFFDRGRDLRYAVFSHNSLHFREFQVRPCRVFAASGAAVLFVFSPTGENLVQSGQNKLLDGFPFLCRQNFQILVIRLAQPERSLLLFFFRHFTSHCGIGTKTF